MPRIYFDFAIDTLFLTFEKDSNEEWEGMFHVEELVGSLMQYDYEVVHKVRSLAIDTSLWHMWKVLLDDADAEWVDDEDEDKSHPEFSVLPYFLNLRELKIVQNPLLGFWRQEARSDDRYTEDDFVDDDVVFLPMSRSEFEDMSGHPFYECPLRRVQASDPEWSMPVLGFLEKL